jgi:hypothetical protein
MALAGDLITQDEFEDQAKVGVITDAKFAGVVNFPVVGGWAALYGSNRLSPHRCCYWIWIRQIHQDFTKN